MTADNGHIWISVIAVSALAGWWLAVRPGASYRGVSSSISVLILLMAALLSALALQHPRQADAAMSKRPLPHGSAARS